MDQNKKHMELNRHIATFDNFFEDPTICDKVIEFFDECEKRNLTYDRRQLVEETLVNDNAFDFRLSQLKMLPIDDADYQMVTILKDTLWSCWEKYRSHYSAIDSKVFISGPKIQKTRPGEGYHTWHYEDSMPFLRDRTAVFSIFLNDNFEAGETEFLYEQIRLKPKKNQCVIWPSGWTHTHRGNPPINGIKYIITGWINHG